MESKRQQKFSRVIQKDLGELFQREASTLAPGELITITAVRTTADLSLVRVHLSFFNSRNPAASLERISAQSREIRFKLAARIKNQVKAIPTLEFFLDDTTEYAHKMDRLFDGLHKNEPD